MRVAPAHPARRCSRSPPPRRRRRQRRVPPGWLGVTADGPLAPAMDGGVGPDGDARRRDGARVAMRWDVAAGRRRRGALDFAGLDASVAAAARAGSRVLPVVQGTPAGRRGARATRLAAADPGDVRPLPRRARRPLRAAGLVLGRAARRCRASRSAPGRSGTSRTSTRYWSEQPFARSYVRLLRAAHAALRAADPGATVVLAGLPNESWKALRQIYRPAGAGRSTPSRCTRTRASRPT